MHLHQFIFFATLLCVCSYALFRGGRPEQCVAAAMLLGVAATRVTLTALPTRYRTVEWPMMIIDVAMLAIFVAIALKADRRWPILLVAIHGLSVASHAAKLLDPNLIRTAYWMLTNLWIYPQFGILAVGTWRHRKRLLRDGADTSWSHF